MKKKSDLTICSFGGGLQTMTIADMVLAGELPAPDAFIFADTGDETTYVLNQVSEMKRRMTRAGIPFLIVNNGNMHADLYGGKRFAAMPLFTKTSKQVEGFGKEAEIIKDGKLKRQCTSEYKIVPIDREIRTMLLEMCLAKETKDGKIRVNKGAVVESWLGYTIDEFERMKPSRHKWQQFRYPLIEKRMYRSDCAFWYTSRGLSVPLSSACRKCPLISNSRQLEMKEHSPIDWKNRLRFDNDLRNGNLRIAATAKGPLYLHSARIPLQDVKLESENQTSMFDCQYGVCMT